MHKLPVVLDIKVTSPEIRRLTAITSHLGIEASGTLTPGAFWFEKGLVTVPAQTEFKLQLNLPMDNPDVINTRNATGSLWTSQHLSVNAVPLPQTLTLEQGKVSGEMNIARSMGAFLINLLQVGVVGGDTHHMIEGATVSEARLELRPGSTLRIGKKEVRIGKDSTVRLHRVTIDKNWDYKGNCSIDIAFDKGSRWLGERVDVTFDGGHAKLDLLAEKVGRDLILSLPGQSNAPAKGTVLHSSPPDVVYKTAQAAGPTAALSSGKTTGSPYRALIEMTPCTFRFGKNKRSSANSATCVMTLQKLRWAQSPRHRNPWLHLESTMIFRDSHLSLKTDIHTTKAEFPNSVPSALTVDVNDNDKRKTSFNITSPARASHGTVSIAKNQTSVVIDLSDALVGPVDFDRFGWLQFAMQQGTARLNKLCWRNKKSMFTLTAGANSTLSIPRGMFIEKNNAKDVTHLTVPLTLKMGTARVTSSEGSVALENLTGKVLVDVDGDVKLLSDLDFTIKESSFLGSNKVIVGVRGLDLAAGSGTSILHLKKCTIAVSRGVIERIVSEQTPHALEIALDKTLVEDKQWRYKNAIAKHVSVSNLTLKEIAPASDSSIQFQASADVLLDGTVEKTGLGSIFGSGKDWETRPWSLSGHAIGNGKVTYEFLPTCKNKPCQMSYTLDLSVPIPQDVKLDWSQVSSGLIKAAERSAIVSRLKRLTVPLSRKGNVTIFNEDDPFWRKVQVQGMSTSSTAAGTKLTFAAEVGF